LLRNADTAMYVAKNAGRNQYCCFTPQLNDLNQRRAHLQRYLRHAAEYHELSLVYQPFVELRTGKIVGAEALLRWHHPRLGTIAPDEFIPLAEETGLIVPLGQWVIHQACQDAQTWREQGCDCWVSVNVSPKQFCSPQIPLLNVIDQALAESGLPEQNLELEITERLMIQDLPNTKTTLDHLRDRQIRLSMDDFCTGYSSLSILRHLPLTLIKIDRSFTMDLPNDPETAILVQTILTMAHNFKFGVIAEGIETPEQRQFLQDFNCEYGQGYLFAKPLPQSEFLALLRDQQR
jgi:EAL domain-containing protein (putative c-di-GMP-specific phosphodiesterase class I)